MDNGHLKKITVPSKGDLWLYYIGDNLIPYGRIKITGLISDPSRQDRHLFEYDKDSPQPFEDSTVCTMFCKNQTHLRTVVVLFLFMIRISNSRWCNEKKLNERKFCLLSFFSTQN